MDQIRTSGSDCGSGVQGGNAKAVTFGLADWLHLAATPTFALMALLSGVVGGGPSDMLCPATHAMSPLGGMTVMYLLMAAFHSTPWLKRVSHWRRNLARTCPRLSSAMPRLSKARKRAVEAR